MVKLNELQCVKESTKKISEVKRFIIPSVSIVIGLKNYNISADISVGQNSPQVSLVNHLHSTS